MNYASQLSPDTEATLLLTGKLGHYNKELPPLTPGQYNLLVRAMVKLQKSPADLIGMNGPDVSLICELCANIEPNSKIKTPEAQHIEALLRRGITLSSALQRWNSYGISVIGKRDPLFPQRLKDHLKTSCPSLLYFAGNPSLFAGGGMGVVGSRNIGEEAITAIKALVIDCVAAQMNIVSGGARGADQTAMKAAFQCGGNVIAALGSELEKACLAPDNRNALASGNILLFSSEDPSDRFSPASAMARNKYIYAMADYAFIAQSDTEGGTWKGATEELKRAPHRPLLVYMATPPADGCQKLVACGATPWDPAQSLAQNLACAETAHPPTPKPEQMSLF